MKKRFYKIAGYFIEISYDGQEKLVALQDFEERNLLSQADIKITLQRDGGAFSDCYGIAYYQADTKRPNIFISQRYPKIRMVADHDYKNAVIGGYCGGYQEGVMELMMMAVYSFLARREWLLLHASLIAQAENGLIFIGKSGIGKTTQAALWKKYLGAEILNGDKVFISGEESGGIKAWGSPWKGSSPYGLNRSVALKAVIALQQGAANQIRQLECMEKLQYLTPHVFYPFWDNGCLKQGMNTMEKLSALPVYLLTCRPDEEAVRLTRDTVFL